MRSRARRDSRESPVVRLAAKTDFGRIVNPPRLGRSVASIIVISTQVACAVDRHVSRSAGAHGAGAEAVAADAGEAPARLKLCAPATRDGRADESGFIQGCLRAAEAGDVVALEPGVYRIDAPVVIDRGVTLTTVDAHGVAAACLRSAAPPCAELRASASFNASGGFLRLVASNITLDHVVLNGNRRERIDTASWQECGRLGGDRRMGFTSVATRCDRCRIQFNAIVGTLCGSGLEFAGDDAVISDNTFLDSGDPIQDAGPGHIPRISDALSVVGARNAILSNLLVDTTDQAIILFDGPGDVVAYNEVLQMDATRPVYSGITIDNSGLDTRGDYTGAEVRHNRVICGEEGTDDHNCHFGIAIGSGLWRPPPVARVTGPTVHGNVVRRARHGIVIEGAGNEIGPVRVWDNDVAHSQLESWDGFIAALGVRLGCSADPVGLHLTSDRSVNPSTSFVCFGPAGCPPPPEGEVWHTDPAHADWRACY